jgi:hypothetical protein
VRVISVVSAHAAGATSIAVALAAVLARDGRVLLVDLNPELAQVAAMLDLDDGTNVYHFAHGARLEPVTAAMVDDHVRWHEGVAVLPGAADPEQARQVRDHFVNGLLDAASARFPWAVIDLGRVRPELPRAATGGAVLWVVTPSPLGLAAFDRRFQQMRAAEAPWMSRAQAVVNQEAEDSLTGVAEFIGREYGLPVVGSVPYEPGFWRGVELSHTLQAFIADVRDDGSFVSWFGRSALRTRRALEAVARRLETSAERAAAEA